jgi:peptidoglycan/LPS O-acetylase OafA/YrhL
MRRKATRIALLGILLLFALCLAWSTWTQGPLDKGAAPFVLGVLMLVVIYVNDGWEWLKERQKRSRDVPPSGGA